MKSLLPIILTVIWCVLAAQTPFPTLPHVYKDNVVPRIDIIMPADSLAKLFAPGSQQSDYHWHATFLFDNGEIKDTVKDVGFRFRGNTSRNSKKKSFKVSFNTYSPGRKWYGFEKLNLNGEHNDPSVARSKICWDMLRWMEVPAPRANHVALYINGNLYGLYVNVEHIDEVFVKSRFGNNSGNLYKCLWPADLTYKGSNPDLYKSTSGGRRTYELITNTEKDDYSDLAKFIDVLNNTPIAQLPCELEKVFNVDAFLKAAAFDVLSANWDGPLYNKNNFYLYNNQASGKLEYIPYDLDNTFGIDWFKIDWATRNIYTWQHPKEPRPIFQRLMQVDEYSNRYSYYFDKYIKAFYNLTFMTPYLYKLRDLIAPTAQTDPYRPLDYNFTYSQFLKSFDEALPVNHTPYGIRQFINDRRISAMQQLSMQSNLKPIIRNVIHTRPTNYQNLTVTAELEDDAGIRKAEVCYSHNGQSKGCLPLLDDGKNADAAAGDGIFGIILPTTGTSGTYEFYIEVTDSYFNQSRYPRCESLTVGISNQVIPLVINEFLASNQKTIKDEAGQYDDWVEILNVGKDPVQLGTLYLSDSENNPKKWKFPEFTLQPMQYLIVWVDDDANQGPMHTNFKLDAAGEYIGIFDTNGSLIDGHRFGQQQTDISWGRLPNGSGPFQALKPTPGSTNAPLTNNNTVHSDAFQVWVFPNPFNNYLHIHLKAENRKSFKMKVFDSLGRIVSPDYLPAGTNEITLVINGKPGLYWVHLLEENGQSVVRKVVKK